MASGTITGSTNNEAIDAKVEWSSTANKTNNTSSVKAALYYKRNNTGFRTYGTGAFSITINGKTTKASKYITITESEWVKAVEATVAVDHSGDGSKSITISATGSITGTTLTSTSLSGTAKLDLIARASTISSVPSYDVTLGQTYGLSDGMNVVWTPLNASFRYKLKFALGSWSNTTSVIHPNQTSAYEYTVSLPIEVANQMPNATKGTMEVTLYTYSNSAGTTQVGSESSKTFTVKVPNDTNTKPSISASLTPSHALTGDLESLYIQGQSKVKATITASGKFGATIATKKIVVEGQTYDDGDSFTSGYLAKSGTIAVKITATDSRGFSQTITKNITVLAYSKPKVVPASGENSIICERCDKDGNFTESGTYLKIKAKRSYSLCKSGGEQKNLCGLRYRYKKVTDAAYSSWVTLLGAASLTTDEVDTIQMNGKLATTSSYIVHIDAVDVVGYHTYAKFEIPTDKVYWHRSGSRNSLGLGKYVERDNALDTEWDIYMNSHRITGLPTPTADSDAVPKSYVDAADIKLDKSLKATGWYKIGTLSGEMCGVATLTIGGVFVHNQASPSMVDIATQYNNARAFLRLPSLADNQISKIGVVKESTKVYGVYAYYNTADENPVSIHIHTHMGTFTAADLAVSSVTESDMLSVVTLKA